MAVEIQEVITRTVASIVALGDWYQSPLPRAFWSGGSPLARDGHAIVSVESDQSEVEPMHASRLTANGVFTKSRLFVYWSWALRADLTTTQTTDYQASLAEELRLTRAIQNSNKTGGVTWVLVKGTRTIQSGPMGPGWVWGQLEYRVLHPSLLGIPA